MRELPDLPWKVIFVIEDEGLATDEEVWQFCHDSGRWIMHKLARKGLLWLDRASLVTLPEDIEPVGYLRRHRRRT